jgi:hypothetical protein
VSQWALLVVGGGPRTHPPPRSPLPAPPGWGLSMRGLQMAAARAGSPLLEVLEHATHQPGLFPRAQQTVWSICENPRMPAEWSAALARETDR